MNAPIALFVYNRPVHTRKTLQKLAANTLASSSLLVVFSDAPKNDSHALAVSQTREELNDISGFQEVRIINREENFGLAKSILTGVSALLDEFGKVIVLEDDLLTSTQFLSFMNDSLDAYQQNLDIFSITGYNYPVNLLEIPDSYPFEVYLSRRNSSWGWATWKDRWDKVDWEMTDYQNFISNRQLQKAFNEGGDDLTDMLKAQMEGVIDSWSIRFTYAHFKENVYALYPVRSLVSNIGQDGSGTHFKDLGDKQIINTLNEGKLVKLPATIIFNAEIGELFRLIFEYSTGFKVKTKLQKWMGYKHWRQLIKK